MTLGKYVKERLYQMAAAQPASGNAGDSTAIQSPECINEVHLSHTGYQVQIACSNYDRHSTELHSLSVTAEQALGDDVYAALQAHAAELIQRLSYLEEPLAICELDGGERTMQLRSSPPQRDDNEIAYWEVEVQEVQGDDRTGITTSISRYHWQPELAERELVPYPATFAFLGRLTDSLA